MDQNNYLYGCLKELVDQGAADLHIKAGELPRIRLRKKLVPIQRDKPETPFLLSLLMPLLNDYQKNIFTISRSVDFAFGIPGMGRFRVNAFYQRGELALVVRLVRDRIPLFEELGLPPVLDKIAVEQRGIILVAGPVGSGKSTTIASMVDYVNHREERRIITVEDPIEFVYRDDKSFISQREIGLDVDSFPQALRYVVRQDPDVIVIGEIRDSETFHTALSAAETGRLVISSVHGKNVMQAFERVLGFYPRDQQNSVLVELSYNLKAIVAQRLLPGKEKGLVPACEILLVNPSAGKVMREGPLSKLEQVMQAGVQEGMQTMNHALLNLFQGGQITREEALSASDHPHALEMNMKGIFLDETSGGILGAKS